MQAPAKMFIGKHVKFFEHLAINDGFRVFSMCNL
jgi:hypothetical protein